MLNASFSIQSIIAIAVNSLLLLAAGLAIVQRKRQDLRFWGLWTIFTAAGFAIGAFIGLFIVNELDETLGLFSFGLVLGTTQWLVIRKQLTRSVFWISATAIGFLCTLSSWSSSYMGWLWIVFSTLLGIAQSHVLGQQFHGSLWWVFASSLGLLSWAFFADGLQPVASELHEHWLIALFSLSSVVYGGLTGFTLTHLLKKPITQAKLVESSISRNAIE